MDQSRKSQDCDKRQANPATDPGPTLRRSPLRPRSRSGAILSLTLAPKLSGEISPLISRNAQQWQRCRERPRSRGSTQAC